MDLCAICHLMHKEASLMELRDASTYGYCSKSIEIILIPYQFSRMMVVISSPGPKTYLDTGSYSISSARYGLFLVEWPSSQLESIWLLL